MSHGKGKTDATGQDKGQRKDEEQEAEIGTVPRRGAAVQSPLHRLRMKGIGRGSIKNYCRRSFPGWDEDSAEAPASQSAKAATHLLRFLSDLPRADASLSSGPAPHWLPRPVVKPNVMLSALESQRDSILHPRDGARRLPWYTRE